MRGRLLLPAECRPSYPPGCLNVILFKSLLPASCVASENGCTSELVYKVQVCPAFWLRKDGCVASMHWICRAGPGSGPAMVCHGVSYSGSQRVTGHALAATPIQMPNRSFVRPANGRQRGSVILQARIASTGSSDSRNSSFKNTFLYCP